MRAPLLDRRTVLRGAGAAVALPWLEAMLPRGIASRALGSSLASAIEPLSAPVARAAFVFIPNGVNVAAWRPASDGAGGWRASPALEPLGDLARTVSVHRGLSHANAAALGDGPGDHARSAACFLTGAHPVKTAGADIRNGRSIDQVIADDLAARGKAGRLPSLELGSEPAMTAGNCDSGYSCAYSANISWRSETLPNGKETDPRAAFERVFGRRDESPAESAARMRSRRSILDGVAEEARRIARSVGRDDRARVDEYLDGVRALEKRIDDDAVAQLDPREKLPDFANAPRELGPRIDMLGEVLALAFRVDATRVATFMLANEGSNRPYAEIGVSAGHHDVSHHGGDAAKLDGFARINRFQTERFAAFLRALERARENGRSVLDSTVVLYGGAITDGNAHNHDDLPILVAGGSALGIKGGRHVDHAPRTPLCNLHLGIARTLGVEVDRFGDATGLAMP